MATAQLPPTSHPPPHVLVHEALRLAKELPESFYPVATREMRAAPCFRSRSDDKEETANGLAEAIFRERGDEYYMLFLRAYITACHKPGGSSLTEAVYDAIGSGPRLPPPSLFAPLGESLEEIITGLGRTLLKLRFNYELILPMASRPTLRDAEQARDVLVEYVAGLAQADPDNARTFVEHLTSRFDQALKKP